MGSNKIIESISSQFYVQAINSRVRYDVSIRHIDSQSLVSKSEWLGTTSRLGQRMAGILNSPRRQINNEVIGELTVGGLSHSCLMAGDTIVVHVIAL